MVPIGARVRLYRLAILLSWQGTLKEGIPFKHGLLVNMASNYLGFIFL